MNREIKYRAWDKKEKQMVYGIEETYDGLPYSELNKKAELDIYDHMSCFSSWLCGDYEVMQFTGLTDTNGVDIYEGDVIASQNKDRDNWYVSHHEIVWYETGFMGKQICSSSYIGLNYWTRGENGYVVIGNIYEKPELLEENK